MVDCTCFELRESIDEEALEIFAAVRSRCPVLNQIFLPDTIWIDFQKWHNQPDTVVHHRSILLLSMERGYLGRVTSAVHRYLITSGQARPDIRQQYLQDLQERWMFYQNPTERHQKFRTFMGRLVELQFAEWLESQGGTVSNLEALREGPDVEAYEFEAGVTAFEIKFISTQDGDFGIILRSLANQSAVASVSPYDAANYLLFRVYEAAKQLQRSTSERIAIVVVEDLTWFRFKLQLNDGWINWDNPQFFSGHDWGGFLERQRIRYPDIANDLQPGLKSLNAVWILRQSKGFQYHIEFQKQFNQAQPPHALDSQG